MDDFSVKNELHGEVAVVAVTGRIDSVTAATLNAQLSKLVHENKKLILDLKDVAYLSSAGVRAILGTSQSAQRAGGGLRLTGVHEPVLRVLQNVGLAGMLPTYASLDEALQGF